MDREYHHYEKWEEHYAGMWRKINGSVREDFIQRAIEFTGNAKLYGSFMLRVIEEWPISCSQNLSATNINRQAWIGHAACCLAIGCPEELTRVAWHSLTQKQQDDANAQADNAIKLWEAKNAKKEARGQLSFSFTAED
jgi:hypothetical protein